VTVEAGQPTISSATHVYIASVCGVAVAALMAAALAGAPPDPGPFIALAVLSAIIWSVGENLVESQVGITLLGILLLAAAVVVGPLGAGLVGVLVAGVSRVRTPWSARVFNMAVSGLLGVVAGVVYSAAGGSSQAAALRGLGPVTAELAIPLLVAVGAQAVVNVILIAGIMRVSQGVPLRLTASRLFLTTGALSLGYAVLATLLVILWLPAGLGAVSVVLALAPLMGAQWALGQYAAQKRTQEQSLELLVAAIELRLPHLVGHAARVGQLAGRLAEHLGLGAAEVRDIERAGLLHDLGQIALPRSGPRPAPRPDGSTHAGRGAQMLVGVAFLRGAAALLAGGSRVTDRPTGSEIVALAAAYDMAVGVHQRDLSVAEFCLEFDPTQSLPVRLTEALAWCVARPRSGTST
jgi:hypothetical protein